MTTKSTTFGDRFFLLLSFQVKDRAPFQPHRGRRHLRDVEERGQGQDSARGGQKG